MDATAFLAAHDQREAALAASTAAGRAHMVHDRSLRELARAELAVEQMEDAVAMRAALRATPRAAEALASKAAVRSADDAFNVADALLSGIMANAPLAVRDGAIVGSGSAASLAEAVRAGAELLSANEFAARQGA